MLGLHDGVGGGGGVGLLGSQSHQNVHAVGLEHVDVLGPALDLVGGTLLAKVHGAQALALVVPLVEHSEAVHVALHLHQLQLLKGHREHDVREVVGLEDGKSRIVQHHSHRRPGRRLEPRQVVSHQLHVSLLDHARLLPLRSL